MPFKNVENSTNFYFYFDGKLIPLTSDHKHLGITFSEEAKWNKHNLYFNLRKTHMCLETLFIKFPTCLFHFASSLNVIPKCLWSDVRKLQVLYNIQNGSTPSYLLDLIPPTFQSTSIYPLRNGNDIIVPFCRLSLTRDSFVSATVREWNNLSLLQRSCVRIILSFLGP
jgi:hypothetical protein